MNHWFKWYARVGVALFIAVVLIAALGGGSASAAGPVYVVVQPGQTLYSIAAHYGVSVWSVACANGLYNPNYIYAGMTLYIPYGWYGACRPNYYPPKPVMYHPPAPKQPCDCFYRVRWGDTLSSIAWRYGTSWTVLAQANHLYNANFIYTGMILRIPGCN
ncbi:MAG: LysM peptidoglycan-binding domain-containing protein [Anaerolineae bacterium]